ncbi:MAG TPA: hypothetical protein VH814_25420, partial [Steroidobacteraceae bacterium]
MTQSSTPQSAAQPPQGARPAGEEGSAERCIKGERARARRPAWLPLVAMIVVVSACVTAGNWQHRRMQEKDALRAALDAANAR